MSGILNLGYVRIGATDVEAWRTFGATVLGTVAGTGPAADAVYLRMDAFPARFIVVPHSTDTLLTVGLEAPRSADVAAVVAALETAGVPYKRGSADDLADRRVSELIQFEDPYGNAIEVFTGIYLDGAPFLSPLGTRFVTSNGGLGHLVLGTEDDVDRGLAFYRDILGFRLRDTMEVPAVFAGKPAEDPPLLMRFLGCGPRHHTIAIAPMKPPSGIVHIMMEVDSLDNVGRAIDRAGKKKGQLASTLGRHANDNMVSFYLNTPSGFMIEYGYDGLTVDDDATWVPQVTGAHTVWGHRWLF